VPNHKPDLVRAIGRWSLAALMVNLIIGGGIFELPSTVAGILGGQSPIAYLLSFAEYSDKPPRSCHSERGPSSAPRRTERSRGTCCLAGASGKAGFSTPPDHPHLRMILLRSK
jgi:hypothetical protein